MSFLNEVRRRKILQVAAVYAITAWLLVQIIVTIEGPLGLPGWFDTAAIVILAAGFPITLVMSWAFNLTPEGPVKDEGDAAPTAAPRRTIEYVLIGLLIAAVSWIVFRETGSQWLEGAPLSNSIAVLPFDNLSTDPDSEYLAAGIHQDVISQLAKLSGLSVRSRTAVLRYGDEKPPIDQIAAELKVAALMEGSVRAEGERVRIALELIDAASGDILWSQTYDQDLRNLFAVESSIATNVASRLQVALSLEDREHITSQPTASTAAYLLYLRGRHLWNQRTDQAVERALAYYTAAIEEDPAFALAYVGIADVWIFRGWYSLLAPGETFPQGKAAVAAALAIDPNLAAAYASRAHIRLEFDHDWAAAEADYERAIELDPGYAIAHHWYGGYLSAMGRHGEALAQAHTARELEPLSPIINTWVGLRHYFWGRPDAAIDEIEQVLALFPEFAPAHWHLGWAYEQTGRFDDAIVEARRAYELTGNPIYLASLAHALALGGGDDEAKKILVQLAQTATKRHVSAYHVATVYAALGEADESFRWLDMAFAERSPWIGYLRVDPRLAPLRSDPRFSRLLTRAKLDS
jgi:TolB-like protein/Flp pilus assembly protein TadD